MLNRLRPMGIREILDLPIAILREKFWAFQWVLFWASLPALIILILEVIMAVVSISVFAPIGMNFWDERFWSEIFEKIGANIIFIIVIFIIMTFFFILATTWGTYYFTYGSIRLYQAGFHNQSCTSKEALKGFGKKFLNYFLLAVFSFILNLAFGGVIGIPMLILESIASILSPVLYIIIYFIRLFIQYLFIFIFCLAPVIVTLENDDIFTAFKRSFLMIKTQFWRKFGIWLASIILIIILVTVSLSFVGIGMALCISVFFNAPSIWMFLLGLFLLLIGLLVFGIFVPLGTGPITALYYDTRIRTEGYDIQLKISRNDNSVEKRQTTV